jgi:CheY-like chemotaxis protein
MVRAEQITSKPRVLLVEDNPNDVLIFRAALKRLQLDWDLHTADGTDAAITHLAPNDCPFPHLLITGILLRERSGHELIRWVRAQSHLQKVPVVALSDTLDPRDREKALELGAVHVVEKTPNMVDAVRAIGELLGKFRGDNGGTGREA